MSQDAATDRFYAEIWPHRATVLRTARYFTQSDTDADDLAQDALLKAFSALDQLQPGSNTKAWLMTILRHTHIDRVRSRHAGEVSLEAMEVDVADERHEQSIDGWRDVDEALQAFGDEQIISALKCLPHDICWTVLLVDVEGLDDHEAAEILSVPTGTVKSRLHRGRRMLRGALAPLAKARYMGSSESSKKT